MKNIISGCPDCDGDLTFVADKGNGVYELQCKVCNSTYIVTIVGGKYESNEC